MDRYHEYMSFIDPLNTTLIHDSMNQTSLDTEISNIQPYLLVSKPSSYLELEHDDNNMDDTNVDDATRHSNNIQDDFFDHFHDFQQTGTNFTSLYDESSNASTLNYSEFENIIDLALNDSTNDQQHTAISNVDHENMIHQSKNKHVDHENIIHHHPSKNKDVDHEIIPHECKIKHDDHEIIPHECKNKDVDHEIIPHECKIKHDDHEIILHPSKTKEVDHENIPHPSKTKNIDNNNELFNSLPLTNSAPHRRQLKHRPRKIHHPATDKPDLRLNMKNIYPFNTPPKNSILQKASHNKEICMDIIRRTQQRTVWYSRELNLILTLAHQLQIDDRVPPLVEMNRYLSQSPMCKKTIAQITNKYYTLRTEFISSNIPSFEQFMKREIERVEHKYTLLRRVRRKPSSLKIKRIQDTRQKAIIAQSQTPTSDATRSTTIQCELQPEIKNLTNNPST